MAPATRGTKRPRKIAAIEEGESPIVQARPSASTSRRKGVKSDRHELDENSGESTDEECVRKKRKKRISVSTRSKKDQYDFWILDENAATNALSCLASIATLPSFCPTAATIRTLEGPSSDGRFTFTHGSIVTSCTHLSTTESLTGIAYGGCAALSYYDLYWSPQLGCLVSLERETVVLTDDLPSVISESGHGTDDCNKNALGHISEHFPMESKDALMKKWRSVELIHPIPGLPNAEVRGKCTKCGFYTAGSITHATKFNCSGKITRDKLSILLLPKTPGREIRIDLQIPDHRPVEASNYNKPKLEQEERSVLAAGPELPTTKEERLIVGWMDKTTSWGRGISAPKLKASTGCDGKFYFEARGTKYSCEHGEDAAPPSQSEYYTGCAVLTYLKLYYSPVLQGIVAPGRGYLLDYGQLKTLVKSRTHGLSDDTILNHVTESFAVQFNPATAFQEVHRKLLLTRPLLGLPKPSLTRQCPDCGISWGNTVPGKLPGHMCKPESKPPTAYTIRLWSGVTEWRYAVPMDQAWIDANSPARIRHTLSPAILYTTAEADFLEGSGYIEHFESWNCEVSAVLQLIAFTPSGREWTTNTHLERVDVCVAQLRKLVPVYVRDVEERLEYHPLIRSAAGTLNHDNRPFTKICKNTFQVVVATIWRLLALAVRYCALCLYRKKYREEFARLGSFNPLLTDGHRSIIKNLLEHLMSSEDLPSNADLLQFIHAFLLEAFGTELPLALRVASIVEQLLVILCLTDRPDKQWRSATHLYLLIGTISRIARSVAVHTACLGGKSVKYQAVNLDAVDNVDVDDALGSGTGSVEEDVPVEELEELEDEWRAASQEQCRILIAVSSSLKILQGLSDMVDDESQVFVNGRICHHRKRVGGVSKAEPFSARVAYDAEQRELSLTWWSASERKFLLDDVRQLSFNSVTAVHQALRNLIPVHIWNAHLASLVIEDFSDDWGRPSIFHVPANIHLLSPAIESFSSHLKQNLALLDWYTDASQQFLVELARALYLNTGIPPHAFQTANLRFADTSTGERHFMLEGHLGLLVWRTGDTVSHGNFGKGTNGVWHIPSWVTMDLIIFLGVYRRIEHRFLTEKHLRLRNGSATHALLTHIFCDPRRRTGRSIIWSVFNVDSAVSSGPLHLSAYTHRILFSSIISNTMKPLIDHLNRPTVMDDQAQHTKHTSDKHYAILPLQHSNGFNYPSLLKQVLVCQDLHASSLLTKPVDTPICSASVGSRDTMAIISPNIPHAFNVARNAAVAAYHLGSVAPGRVEVIARMACLEISLQAILTSSCPGRLGGSGFTMADLLLVSRSLLGRGMEAEHRRTSAQTIASIACALMLRAIREWITGEPKSLGSSTSPFSESWSADVQSFREEKTALTLPQWEEFIDKLPLEEDAPTSEVEEYDLLLPDF
ncbi:hypothetical protein NMY22_g2920 [Coprinellus aureogranulatus]|nr:hypothetical protein NMY22_g2920 [Coprinellus aureogranulatus]